MRPSRNAHRAPGGRDCTFPTRCGQMTGDTLPRPCAEVLGRGNSRESGEDLGRPGEVPEPFLADGAPSQVAPGRPFDAAEIGVAQHGIETSAAATPVSRQQARSDGGLELRLELRQAQTHPDPLEPERQCDLGRTQASPEMEVEEGIVARAEPPGRGANELNEILIVTVARRPRRVDDGELIDSAAARMFLPQRLECFVAGSCEQPGSHEVHPNTDAEPVPDPHERTRDNVGGDLRVAHDREHEVGKIADVPFIEGLQGELVPVSRSGGESPIRQLFEASDPPAGPIPAGETHDRSVRLVMRPGPPRDP